jgi:predicted phosphodiesterase
MNRNPRPSDRILAISDLHVDYDRNMDWLRRLTRNADPVDTLLIAGDVSSDLRRTETALGRISQAFANVFFVPGNHDLWVRPASPGDSLDKLDRLLALCNTLGVHTAPGIVRPVSEGRAVKVVPLHSWYVRPEEGHDSLYAPKPGEDPSLSRWADDHRIRWNSQGIRKRCADYFLALNEPALIEPCNLPVLSFSHFLPRQDLIRPTPLELQRGAHPYDRSPGFNFSRVAGTSRLDSQIRRLGSKLHVYGHQHRNRDRTLEGVRYVSNCLGYPHERASEIDGNPSPLPRLVCDLTQSLPIESLVPGPPAAPASAPRTSASASPPGHSTLNGRQHGTS